MKIKNYNGKAKIFSLALNDDVKNKLQAQKLDVLYISGNKMTLYQGNNIIMDNIPITEKLQFANNYDVYELLDNGVLVKCYDDSIIDNYFFLTPQCNSNCIMCPSPVELRRNGKGREISYLIEIAKHIPDDTFHLTITGGEPFLLGEQIFYFILFLKQKFKYTEFLFLTNGRVFAIDRYVQKFKLSIPKNSIVAIPIHGSCAKIHDEITQTDNSFLQTIAGVKNLLRNNIKVEIRIVVNKMNITDIENIASLIINELQSILYVSIIAMEMTGSAYLNREKIWISYKAAATGIQKAIVMFMQRGIDVRLYNFPMCTVDKKFRMLCEKSISSSKVRYCEKCNMCKMRKSCGGVFAGTILMEEEELQPII